MATMIRLELLKLRRTSLLWVGTAAGMLAILVSFYLAAADHMTQYTVAIFMGNLAANNRSSLFPFVAVLTVGRMMEWERTSRTLPGLLTVPVRFPALLGTKLAAGLPLTVGYSLLQWVLGILCCLVLRLPGIAAGQLLADLLVLTGSNLCVYVAVLPIIALAAQFAGGYIPGTVFAVFYGFCSIFISGHGLAHGAGYRLRGRQPGLHSSPGRGPDRHRPGPDPGKTAGGPRPKATWKIKRTRCQRPILLHTDTG